MTEINAVPTTIPQVMNHGTIVPMVAAVALVGMMAQPRSTVMTPTSRAPMPPRVHASDFLFIRAYDSKPISRPQTVTVSQSAIEPSPTALFNTGRGRLSSVRRTMRRMVKV